MPYVQLTDLNIHYREKGDGKTLFFLHGIGNNSTSWLKQIDELSKDFHVIAWDAPGYGKSSDQFPDYQNFVEFSEVLNEMLDKLGEESIFLVGHSMGAATAVDFAYRFPERVEKLIISNTPRGSAGISESDNKEKLEKRLYAIDVQGPKVLAKERARQLFSPFANEEKISIAENIMSQVRGPGYRSGANSLFHLDQTEIFPEITAPTLLICGEMDEVTTVADSRFIHERILNSTFEVIPKTGHLCYMEEPLVFSDLVRDHFLGYVKTEE